jgi:hypothetical protein
MFTPEFSIEAQGAVVLVTNRRLENAESDRLSIAHNKA